MTDDTQIIDALTAAKPDCRSGAALEAQAENVGIGKSNLEVARCFALAVVAGMEIGMGATFMLLVKSDASLSFAASQLLGGVCFSLGLLCVIVAGAELFTGNVLMVCAALSKKIGWVDVLKNWGIVFVGNLVGSLLLVGIIAGSGFANMNSGAIGNAMVNVAYAKISLDASTIVFRGIMCNILVCLAVWMGFAGRTVIDKVFTTIIPVAAFVACGFEHCIANMFFLPMGMVALGSGFTGSGDMAAIQSAVNVQGALYNIGFATIGNIIGGAVFVGAIYWFAYHKKA